MPVDQKPPVQRFGEILGYAPGGVPVYSSDYDTADNTLMPDRRSFRSYVKGVYTGYKWQCVEFARRWLLLNKGYVFDDIAMAYDIFRLDSVRVVDEDRHLPLRSFRNGSRRHPEPGCMLIWNEGGEFHVTGHVAIVTEVFPDGIRIAEQNVGHHLWPEGQDYSRELAARVSDDGRYWISCTFGDASILGWVVQTEEEEDAEHRDAPDSRLFTLQSHLVEDNGQHLRPWLNLANPDEAAFVDKMEGHWLSSVEEDQYRYIRMSSTALHEIKRATNELHALFMHATDYVMQNPELLRHFNIPRVLWPRIVQSWNNRRNQMITGRFDFAMTREGIKLYEYNADSASCYMECGKVQGLWAQHFGCDDGWNPGNRLYQDLVVAWKESEVEPGDVVHIMQDDDKEETYHALFMKSAMEEAGITCRIIHGTRNLHWDNNGDVVDDQGTPIHWVWKTWAWETALDQLREELDEEGALPDKAAIRQRPPRLMDVLFRPGVMVFEPLWTLVTSNKALLPILWEMFPEMPYLLNSRFELGDDLKETGYVSKPIAGRCGYNVSLFDGNEDLMDETGGQFDHQEQIYQALWRLPRVGEYNVQLCSFSVAGVYSGACVRVDKSPIITTDSDILPLRVVSDREFLQG
jgi:glutathionylspermidine amidase/synthetase